jgi:Ser/Thr protein kinase RdoA (MazF antagonist)
VHADLFRDNVMFEDGALTGFFDFYFAGVDSWLFDLAVCLNDWCIDLPTGAHDGVRAATPSCAPIRRVRPLAAAERRLLPAMLRAGALRFWISRLWDFHLPREASCSSRTTQPLRARAAPARRASRSRPTRDARCVKLITLRAGAAPPLKEGDIRSDCLNVP